MIDVCNEGQLAGDIFDGRVVVAGDDDAVAADDSRFGTVVAGAVGYR